MVSFRLDRRLWGRLDPSDVIQDVFVNASKRLQDYLADPSMPFFLWLRFLTCQELITLHRRHLGATMRDAGRDVSLNDVSMDSSSAIAVKLAVDQQSPSEAVVRDELAEQIRAPGHSLLIAGRRRGIAGTSGCATLLDTTLQRTVDGLAPIGGLDGTRARDARLSASSWLKRRGPSSRRPRILRLCPGI
jgi:hypothetical protein